MRKPRTAKAWIPWVKDGGFCFAYTGNNKELVKADCEFYEFTPDSIVRVTITEVVRPPKARRTKP